MRWIKPNLRHSISALLGTDVRRKSPESLEPIRQAMLDVLGDEGAELNPRLKRKLQYSGDAQGLWYARSEMVAVLSRIHGEAIAVNKVRSLTPYFQGCIPRGLIESSGAPATAAPVLQ